MLETVAQSFIFMCLGHLFFFISGDSLILFYLVSWLVGVNLKKANKQEKSVNFVQIVGTTFLPSLLSLFIWYLVCVWGGFSKGSGAVQ